MNKSTCPDCAAKIGQAHIKGCDVERCTVCKGQRLSCSCKGHNRKEAVWKGDWPGVKECQERGPFQKATKMIGSLRPPRTGVPHRTLTKALQAGIGPATTGVTVRRSTELSYWGIEKLKAVIS